MSDSCQGLTYGDRELEIERLGFGSYKEYLMSDTWEDVRARARRNHSSSKCRLCNKNRHLVAHHFAYTKDNLSGRTAEHIYMICKKCHVVVEFKRHSKKKRTLLEAQRVFIQKLRRSRWEGPRFCPLCHQNRSFQGGPCPPCLARQERALTESSSTDDRLSRGLIQKAQKGSEGEPDSPGARATTKNQEARAV